MGNGDEPEQPDNPNEPDITPYTLKHITVTDDLGVEYHFNGTIHMDVITIAGETHAFVQMKPIN